MKPFRLSLIPFVFHGDNPEAVAFTKELREGLEKAGLTVANFAARDKEVLREVFYEAS